MIHKVFSLYDSKSEVYDMPMFAKTTNDMIRDLTHHVNTENNRSKLYLHPSDFTLFEIGTYDDTTGVFTKLNTLHSVLVLHELRNMDLLPKDTRAKIEEVNATVDDILRRIDLLDKNFNEASNC